MAHNTTDNPAPENNSSPSYTLLFDLDGTLVQAAKWNDAQRRDVIVQRLRYRLGFGAIELLAAASERSNVNVAFYSAGEVYRNKPLVLELGNRVVALNSKLTVDEWYSLDVWSRHHMEDGCYKNLHKLPKIYDLSTTLLIDDSRRVVPSEQHNHLLEVVGIDKHIQPAKSASALQPLDHARSKYSLVRVAGILALSWELHESGEAEWLEAVGLLQMHCDGDDGSSRVMSHSRELYDAGLELLRRINPELSLEPVVTAAGEHVYPWSVPGDASDDSCSTDIAASIEGLRL